MTSVRSQARSLGPGTPPRARPLRPRRGDDRAAHRAPSLRSVGASRGRCDTDSLASSLIAVAGAFVSRTAAEDQAVDDARRINGVIARTVVEPHLRDGLLTGDPAALDAMREAATLLTAGPVLRLKLWTPDGRIVYSDDERLVGRRYPLEPDEAEVLVTGEAAAEISDLSRAENDLEHDLGTLLEVYRPVHTPSGRVLGLRLLDDLADDVSVVGSAGSGVEGLEMAAALRPDVVLMDLSMPGMSGVEATRRLLAAHPDTAVVVLTSFAEPDLVVDALDAGAIGYLLKDAEPDGLVGAVRAAARGESPLDPRAARIVLTGRAKPAPVSVLSGREKEVLVLVAEGLANKQIARTLGIAERTVKAHLTSVFTQIGVADRTSAALWAHRRGLVGSPPRTPPGR